MISIHEEILLLLLLRHAGIPGYDPAVRHTESAVHAVTSVVIILRCSQSEVPCLAVLTLVIRSILNPLAGKFSEDTRKKGKGAKTGASHNWRSFYLSQNDWLKGSHMTKVLFILQICGAKYSLL